MRIRWLLSLMLLLLMAPMLIAQDDDKENSKQEEDEPKTVAEKFEMVERRQSKMMRDLGSKYRKAKNAEERAEIMKERTDLEAELSEITMGLVKESDDADLQVKMLSWITQTGPAEMKKSATDMIMTDHFESEALKGFASGLGRSQPSAETEGMIRKLMEKSPHDSVKAAATMSMVSFLQGIKRFAEMPDNVKKQVAKSLGDGGAELLEKWDAESIDEEVINLLESVVENYGDEPAGRGSTLGEMAESQLFSLKYLQIGKVAPDIEGNDLDEVSFKLSDYRGKVVVLDFWGDW